MRRVCFVCKIMFGLKEPLEDDSETHGLCPECFKIEMTKLDGFWESGVDPWKKVD